MIPIFGGDPTVWWKLATIITCGTLAGAVIPELVKVFTSTESAHVKEVVTASREGGASLNILAGLIAGNFSAYWMGLAIVALMGIASAVAATLPVGLMLAPAIFAFGLVAFGFLGMGPVTIAVDSYGPVTDNAQSIYELSTIETLPGIREELKRDYGYDVDFERAKHHLEANDGAGNTFKATAKPVLIGTAVVGAVTLIFSIIMVLTAGLTENIDKLSLLHPPFLLGLVTGGAMIYWFSGASCQAVSTGAYRAVEFIKRNIRLDAGAERASIADSKRVVEICTTYAQRGMFNIFLTVFFATLAFACLEPFFFIGYLISIAIFGLYQAIFMANAGGAWDNAKKIVEVELKEKGTALHAATVVGDTVGDPFKDTSSVAMNPVIKFTTLFGLLAVELAIELPRTTSWTLAALFFVVSAYFVWRSFYRMRIEGAAAETSGIEATGVGRSSSPGSTSSSGSSSISSSTSTGTWRCWSRPTAAGATCCSSSSSSARRGWWSPRSCRGTRSSSAPARWPPRRRPCRSAGSSSSSSSPPSWATPPTTGSAASSAPGWCTARSPSSSARTTSTRPPVSSSATAARRSSSPASCPSSAPSRRSSPASGT